MSITGLSGSTSGSCFQPRVPFFSTAMRTETDAGVAGMDSPIPVDVLTRSADSAELGKDLTPALFARRAGASEPLGIIRLRERVPANAPAQPRLGPRQL